MTRSLPEEVPVALVYNGSTQAVMMATPEDLEDFATGFSLSERIVDDSAEIESLDIVPHPRGMEARMWLTADRAASLAARRRVMAGPIGCGLCGLDSLEEALRPVPPVPASAFRLHASDIVQAMDDLRRFQPLHDRTRAVHAAGFFVPGEGIVMAREDVGRHNALDKLIGAMARGGRRGADGAILLTSRVSIDMVQKCAAAGAGVLVAVSAPTAHAVRLAEAAGITVAAFAHGSGFDVFSHLARITPGASPHVA